MPKEDEKGAASTEKTADQPKGDQTKAAEAVKEQPKSKSVSKVRSVAERLRRNPWR